MINDKFLIMRVYQIKWRQLSLVGAILLCTQDRDRTGTPKNWCLRPARLPIPPPGPLMRCHLRGPARPVNELSPTFSLSCCDFFTGYGFARLCTPLKVTEQGAATGGGRRERLHKWPVKGESAGSRIIRGLPQPHRQFTMDIGAASGYP